MQSRELLHLLISTEQSYKEAVRQIQAQGAALFKAIRAEHRLTQRQLADILNVDFTFISKVENGYMRPGKPVLTRLATWIDQVQEEAST